MSYESDSVLCPKKNKVQMGLGTVPMWRQSRTLRAWHLVVSLVKTYFLLVTRAILIWSACPRDFGSLQPREPLRQLRNPCHIFVQYTFPPHTLDSSSTNDAGLKINITYLKLYNEDLRLNAVFPLFVKCFPTLGLQEMNDTVMLFLGTSGLAGSSSRWTRQKDTYSSIPHNPG